jgi:GNAT superfamily N-acetyltransferase
MHIRPARPEDANAISALIHSVAHYFTVKPDGSGADEFLTTISPEAISRYISGANFQYLAGFVDQALVGVVAVRDNKHLYHLFVSPQFQRRGYAKALWKAAMDKAIELGNPGEFTVNSTPFAAPVYESFGFEALGPKVETKGIAYIPMRYSRPRTFC